MKITRIKPPKYKVGRYSLNEYELRQLMLEVAKKEKHFGIIVTDKDGYKATIMEDGSLSCNLFGTDIMSRATLDMIRLRREDNVAALVCDHCKSVKTKLGKYECGCGNGNFWIEKIDY